MSAVVNPMRLGERPGKAVENVVVGKDILELLTGAMYTDPLCILREYVQNAVDSIEDARDAGLYAGAEEPAISIVQDAKTRAIRITDNGAGIPAATFLARLTAIGASQKRGTPRRGFRGVGRLSGLGYCQELVFRSQAQGENHVSELRWDGRQLRELLRDAKAADDLASTVRSIVMHSTAVGKPDQRFFEVELRGIGRLKNDQLLNPTVVSAYLSQVAPVPFPQEFQFGKDIDSFLTAHGVSAAYCITLNGVELFRPFKDSFALRPGRNDHFQSVETHELQGPDGELAAVGWVLHHSYNGSLPKALAISGLRLRAKNIQVGTSALTAEAFLESRFNDWCVGEFHVVSKKLVPNGRRDDFEPSLHYQHLQSNLSVIGRKLSKQCRDESAQRTRLARVKRLRASIDWGLEGLSIWGSIAPIPPILVKSLNNQLNALEKGLTRTTASIKEMESRRKRFSQLKTHGARGRPPSPERAKLAYQVLQSIQASLPSSPNSSRIAKKVLHAVLRG